MEEKPLAKDEQAAFKRADNVEEIAFGKRFALYRSGAERVLILNKTGSLLWKRLESPQSRGNLQEYLQTQFSEISKPQLQSDLAAYLHELSTASCIETVVLEAARPGE